MRTDCQIHRPLLHLADPRLPADAQTTPSLSTEQWQQFFALAAAHGVVGIVVQNLNASCAANRDAWLLAQRFLRAKQVRSLRLRRFADELLDRLAAAGVPAVDFKGSDFADYLYPKPGLRPTNDIDILVPRDRLNDTAAVLTQLGYAKAVAPPMRFAESEYGEQSWNHRAAADIEVDLHWNLINHPSLRRRASIEMADLDWETVANRPGRLRATPATRLIIAAAHATFGHQFDRLLLLCDIREACRSLADDASLADLRRIAKRTGTRAALEVALGTTARWLADPCSADLLRRLNGRAITRSASLLVSEHMLLQSGGRGHYVRRRLLRELFKRAA
jgi:hypothetical protein